MIYTHNRNYGLTNRVETVLWSSAGPGNMVSTTMAEIPEDICSSAASPPSAAAAVSACWKSTAPTRVSRAKSFSYVLTAGREVSVASKSTTASRTACSEVNGDDDWLWEEEADERRE